MSLHKQIFIAIVLAVIIGGLTSSQTTIFSVPLIDIHGFFGTLYLNLLKMVVIPLVSSSIICGVANLVKSNSFSQLGSRTIIFYMATCAMAIMLGLIAMNLFEPGKMASIDVNSQTEQQQQDLDKVLKKVEDKGSGDIVGVFLRMVPANIVEAMSADKLLGIIFFCIVFGVFLGKLRTKEADTIFNFWKGVNDLMINMTVWVIKFAPFGVYALIAKNVALTGFASFLSVFEFFIIVAICLAIHLFVTLSLTVKFFTGVSPIKHLKAMADPLVSAFSTSSSSATIPITMRAVQDVNVSKNVSSCLIPLGATVNMDGTALYECMAVMFIAQCYGVDLSISAQIVIVISALLTSIGVAGIPAGSLVAITIILTTVGLPLEGIALLLITDRFLDMMRTTVNVYGDTCAATVVASLMGEKVYPDNNSEAKS